MRGMELRWVKDWESEERRLIAIGRLKRDMLNTENGGLLAKSSQKRLSRSFVFYRRVMASLAKWANEKDRNGDQDGAARTRASMRFVRSVVAHCERQCPHDVERFYQRVEARLKPRACGVE